MPTTTLSESRHGRRMAVEMPSEAVVRFTRRPPTTCRGLRSSSLQPAPSSLQKLYVAVEICNRFANCLIISTFCVSECVDNVVARLYKELDVTPHPVTPTSDGRPWEES